MSEDTGARQARDALSNETPKFESRHQIFDYLLNEASRLDLEKRERVLRDHYVDFLRIGRADKEKQEKELAVCTAYQKERAKMQEAHQTVADFLKKQLDDARGESVQQLSERLQELSDRESDAKNVEKAAKEQGQRYDAELTRVSGYETKLKKRDDELNTLQGDLERKSIELSERTKLVYSREEAVAALEKTLGEQSNELHNAMPFLRTFLKRGTEFYSMVDEMVKYYGKMVNKLPAVQVPPAQKKDDSIVMPKSDDSGGETMLGLGDVGMKPK